MGVIGVLLGLGLFIALLWNFAIYALPAFIGMSAGWWSLNHGAGIGCVVVGLIVGIGVFLAGRTALMSTNPAIRLLVLALFVIPAAFAGYGIVMELSGSGTIPSSFWRHLFAIAGAIAVGAAAAARLLPSVERASTKFA